MERLAPEMLATSLAGASKLVVSIDVAKTKMRPGFGREDGSVARLVKWTSPVETRAFVELVVSAFTRDFGRRHKPDITLDFVQHAERDHSELAAHRGR
jgi:hypothetical protein